MFEGISMITLDVTTPIVKENYKKKLTNFADISKDGRQAFRGSFVLSGKSVQGLLPLPVAEHISPDLISLQIFVAIDGDREYYTRRENYPSYLLLYTYAGKGTLEYEGQSYTLNRGDGFFIDCTKPHYYKTCGERWHHSDLHFAGRSADLLYQEFQKDGSVVFSCTSNNQYQTYLMKVLKNYSILSLHREFYVHDAISSLIGFVLKENEKNSNQIPDIYQYLLKYLESNYNNNLSLEQLSKFSGISKYHLSREFKKYTGFSPIDYMIELRITHAKFLLSNTDLPAYRIGELVGIPNETNFMRLFKKKTGGTPGHYRNAVDMI